jgi:hypothetical protein
MFTTCICTPWSLYPQPMHALQASMPNCTVPSRLKKYNTWNYCKEWARWVNPKGFRSSFG